MLLTLLGCVSHLLTPVLFAYNIAVHSNIPKVVAARTLWIETAMTTADHQWLATSLFPKTIVDEVMSKKVVQEDLISTPELLKPIASHTEIPTTLPFMADPEADKEPDIYDQEVDEHGNKIIVSDREQALRIVELKTPAYTGRLILVDDPSRVVIATTNTKNSRGQTLQALVEGADAIAGINANGFSDPEGRGHGGNIIGWTVSEGKSWGSGSKKHYISAGFDTSNRLIVGNIGDFGKYNIRDLSQWQPALIVDGVQKVTGSAGWGAQPRTAIAQTESGQVILAVIDGRQPGYSIGITVGELADILFAYGAYNAALCDGGSSSTMVYDGKLLGKVSTTRKDTGRYLPNAWVVKRIE